MMIPHSISTPMGSCAETVFTAGPSRSTELNQVNTMRHAPLLLLFLLATGLASCDSTNPANPLTERETVVLLREIVLLLDESGDSSTVDCSVGGEATVTVTTDEGESGDSAWFEGRATIAPTDCEVDVVSDTLTLNGEPNVEYTEEGWVVFDDDFEIVKGEVKAVFGGAMTWQRRNGDTDTCSVDLTFESTEIDESGDVEGDFRGRMCGLDLVVDPDEL